MHLMFTFFRIILANVGEYIYAHRTYLGNVNALNTLHYLQTPRLALLLLGSMSTLKILLNISF